MSKLSTEYRLKCLELATQVTNPREPLEDRTEKFCEFVGGDDPTRLNCLRVATKTHGPLARIYAAGILDAAAEYLKIVLPPAPARVAPPQPEPPKKRGRKR